MTEESESKRGASTHANVTGWKELANELQHQIIAHAVDDSDAWKAHETFSSVLRTSRPVRDLANSEALRRYKANLDGGRLVSDAVIETAFPNRNFSDDDISWSRRHIGHEAGAVAAALEFQSPEIRSEIFNNISAKDVDKRMLGYSHLVERADLFQEHETNHMYRDALNTFRDDNPPGTLTRYSAATVLVKGYYDIGDEARRQIQEAVSTDEAQAQREDLCDAIVNCNPSLLKDDSLRSLVRENLRHLEDPHEALAQLASYIDKNSQTDTDFIIEQSFRKFGGMTVDGEEHGLRAPALAIAKVYDGNIRQEHRDRIAELRQSDTEEGHALASAFKELEPDQSAEASIEGGMRGSAKLLRQVVSSQNMSGQVAAIQNVGDVAKSAESK